MPHHDRARLAEINEKKLDPKTKYVLGKKGLVKPSKALLEEAKLENLKSDDDLFLIKEKNIEEKCLQDETKKEEILPFVEASQVVEASQEKINLQDKSQTKKKNKFKPKSTLESES